MSREKQKNNFLDNFETRVKEKILLASVTFFKVALCASLPSAKARGAICVSVLASELSDTLSLDYQRSSHPTQYPTKFLDTNEEKADSFPHWKANGTRYIAIRVKGSRNEYEIYKQN